MSVQSSIAAMQQAFPVLTVRECSVAHAVIFLLMEHIQNETAMMENHYPDATIAREVLLRAADPVR